MDRSAPRVHLPQKHAAAVAMVLATAAAAAVAAVPLAGEVGEVERPQLLL